METEYQEKKRLQWPGFESKINAEVSESVSVQNFFGGDNDAEFAAASPVVLSLIPGSPLHQVITQSSPRRSSIIRLCRMRAMRKMKKIRYTGTYTTRAQ